MENLRNDNRPFAVVSFPEELNSLAVVSAKWLVPEGTECKCWWPPYKGETRFTAAVKSGEHPGVQWNVYPITVRKMCSTYEKASRFLEKYTYQSEFESSCSEIDKIAGQRKTVTVQSLPEEGTSMTPVVPRNIKNSSSSVIKCTGCCELTVRLEAIEKSLAELRNAIEENSTLLEKNLIKGHGDISDISLNFKEASTYEELMELNEKLADDQEFAAVVSRLGILGGKDTAEATRRILAQVLNNDLAKTLNWVGGEQKRSILDFPNVLQLISASVRRNRIFKDTPINVVEDHIKRWLRYAPDRQGGRMKRMKK